MLADTLPTGAGAPTASPGRARSTHFSEGAAGGELPEVGVDYAFLGDGARENSMPILVCRGRVFGFHGAIFFKIAHV